MKFHLVVLVLVVLCAPSTTLAGSLEGRLGHGSATMIRGHAAAQGDAAQGVRHPQPNWSVSKVGDWLHTIDLGELRQSFADASVDGLVLASLTDDDLAEVGVTHFLHRRKILMHRGLPSDAVLALIETGSLTKHGTGRNFLHSHAAAARFGLSGSAEAEGFFSLDPCDQECVQNAFYEMKAVRREFPGQVTKFVSRAWRFRSESGFIKMMVGMVAAFLPSALDALLSSSKSKVRLPSLKHHLLEAWNGVLKDFGGVAKKCKNCGPQFGSESLFEIALKGFLGNEEVADFVENLCSNIPDFTVLGVAIKASDMCVSSMTTTIGAVWDKVGASLFQRYHDTPLHHFFGDCGLNTDTNIDASFADDLVDLACGITEPSDLLRMARTKCTKDSPLDTAKEPFIEAFKNMLGPEVAQDLEKKDLDLIWKCVSNLEGSEGGEAISKLFVETKGDWFNPAKAKASTDESGSKAPQQACGVRTFLMKPQTWGKFTAQQIIDTTKQEMTKIGEAKDAYLAYHTDIINGKKSNPPLLTPFNEECGDWSLAKWVDLHNIDRWEASVHGSEEVQHMYAEMTNLSDPKRCEGSSEPVLCALDQVVQLGAVAFDRRVLKSKIEVLVEEATIGAMTRISDWVTGVPEKE